MFIWNKATSNNNIMSKEITENNKLIAQFMGYTYFPFNNPEGFTSGWWKEGILSPILTQGKDRLFLCRHHNELRYYNSWDWLIPVLKKIESLGCIINLDFCFNIQCRICVVGSIAKLGITFYSELNDLNGVYDCIIQFINYHNKKYL